MDAAVQNNPKDQNIHKLTARLTQRGEGSKHVLRFGKGKSVAK